ncbi:hypothetical protein MAPG_03714 [Magnaporthiopsis poae ATCC 64411]|uniref:Uncharacterized protein n=1 Tax=Magnaporthiopsis poae (strain ATCC 64411 / 73-15) TaxID=644358 RepID=A0A0C4DUS1_MAGP6|nr:hypothetical protein MAPG_03714 [Magnaporthiopsis poae ATCC 64411]
MASRASSIGEDSIPLYCALCPERENFSDVSHLLTHISSKSHLSRKFDTELRAQGDNAVSAARLAEYQRWYATHRIGDLLQRRMETKQRRRQPRRERAAPSPLPTRASRAPRSVPSRRPPSVKAEPREDSADVFDLHSRDSPAGTSHGILGRQTAGRYDSPGNFNGTPRYQTPTSGRGRSALPPNYAGIGKFEAEGSEADGSSFDGTLSLENFELEDDDTVKLKGVTYPGMAGFDAATPEQRRKRNQKKDKSVVESMRETSESIEPLEYIWDGLGNFKRSRDIYASPSPEGSPVLKKAELPAKRKRRQTKIASPTANRVRPGVTTRGAARAQRQAAARQSPIAVATKQDSDDGHDDSSWTTGHGGGDMLRPDDHHIPNRMNSPLDPGGFQLHHRGALHHLDNNGMIGSHEQNAIPKHQHYPYPYFGQASQARNMGVIGNQDYHSYMQPHQIPGDANFNPLNLRGVAASSFSTMPNRLSNLMPSAYDDPNDVVQSTTFQPINARFGTNHGGHHDSLGRGA